MAITASRAELADNKQRLVDLAEALAPGLLELPGVGPVSAAQVIVSWSHPGRCRNEAAFAALGGFWPRPASSGRTVRHRLNRGGDRALHDLRPVYHRLEQRIRAHILLCLLALLLAPIIENATGATWTTARAELARLHVGTFTGPAGTYHQTTTQTAEAKRILTALVVDAPPRVLHLDTTHDEAPTPA